MQISCAGLIFCKANFGKIVSDLCLLANFPYFNFSQKFQLSPSHSPMKHASPKWRCFPNFFSSVPKFSSRFDKFSVFKKRNLTCLWSLLGNENNFGFYASWKIVERRRERERERFSNYGKIAFFSLQFSARKTSHAFQYLYTHNCSIISFAASALLSAKIMQRFFLQVWYVSHTLLFSLSVSAQRVLRSSIGHSCPKRGAKMGAFWRGASP